MEQLPAREGSAFARAHWIVYVLLGVLALHVLLRASPRQIIDTNFYVLWESTALLAGDHPYRDFYQWGSPLLTLMSTAVQWLVGKRLIGELAIHWAFMVAAVLLGFHLATRLARSVLAAMVTSVLLIMTLAATGTFSFPKMFFYPLAVSLGWWYIERPGPRRGALMGLVTGVAFLYRHDHGIYIGFASVLAFGLARVARSASPRWRDGLSEVAAYAAAAALTISPWAIVVERNEGLIDYIRTRSEWNQTWAPNSSPFLLLRDLHPGPVFTPRGPGAGSDDEPSLRDHFPTQPAALHWLAQTSILVPLLALGSVGFRLATARVHHIDDLLHASRILLASCLALIVSNFLFREDGYFSSTGPLTAAIGAQLLADAMRSSPSGGHPWLAGAWRSTRGAIAVFMLATTAVAVVGFVDELRLLAPITTVRDMPLDRLFASPPIDAYQPREAAQRVTPEEWTALERDRKQEIMIRYMHDCTSSAARILVTGSTPYHVGYYVDRPVAGGHVQWHHRWRSDPVHEAQSLALIRAEPVPFAFSTHDPVLEDFKAYPRIHEYLSANYVEIPGSDGLLLVDRRRQSERTFGRLGFPCFR